MLTADYSTCRELVNQFNDLVDAADNVLLRSGCVDDPVLEFAQSVARGLTERPRALDCRYLYDKQGSQLYESITRQPEYYLTRTEASILARYASELARITGPVTMIELGSGSSVKTNHLLSAYLDRETCICYVPIDVSESALLGAAYAITERHPQAKVIGINDTYENAFSLMEPASPTMVVFLGSTLGNLSEAESEQFWGQVGEHLPQGDYFLLGVDLVKEPNLIHAAYNDRAGVTAAFTCNLFVRMNRELGSCLDVDFIKHVAEYNPRRSRVEISARFEQAQEIWIDPLRCRFHIEAGEQIKTEISRKFRLEELTSDIARFGMRVNKVWTDEHDWFALLLLQRV